MKTNAQIKKASKAALSGNWFAAVCVYLLYMLIAYVLGLSAVGSLFIGIAGFGYTAFCLELAKKKHAGIGVLFGGMFKKFFKKWGASLLVSLYTFLWTLLFIIPGIVKSYSYALAPYILLEKPEMGIKDAITKSRMMMKGHKWQLFCLDLSFIGWMLLCVLTLGIAFFYVWPYYSTARAQFYKELKRAPKKE